MNEKIKKLKELIAKYTIEDAAEQSIEAWEILKDLKELKQLEESGDRDKTSRPRKDKEEAELLKKYVIYPQHTKQTIKCFQVLNTYGKKNANH